MDLGSAMATINFWAVLAAAASAFVIGGLWYSPALFHRPWMQAAGLSEQQLAGANTGLIFGVAFVLELIAAFVLAMFIGREADLAFGLTAGLMAGLFWVCTAFGVVYLFERRPIALFLINGGYQVVVFAVMGAIIGAWR